MRRFLVVLFMVVILFARVPLAQASGFAAPAKASGPIRIYYAGPKKTACIPL